MQFPVSIELHRSRLLATVLVAVHAGAAGCVLVLPWRWGWQAALLLALAVSLSRALRPARLVALHLRGRHVLEGGLVDGRRVALTLLPESTVFRWLVVLRLRIENDRRVVNVCVLPDQLGAQDFRLLRVWLRCQSPSGVPVSPSS